MHLTDGTYIFCLVAFSAFIMAMVGDAKGRVRRQQRFEQQRAEMAKQRQDAEDAVQNDEGPY